MFTIMKSGFPGVLPSWASSWGPACRKSIFDSNFCHTCPWLWLFFYFMYFVFVFHVSCIFYTQLCLFVGHWSQSPLSNVFLGRLLGLLLGFSLRSRNHSPETDCWFGWESQIESDAWVIQGGRLEWFGLWSDVMLMWWCGGAALTCRSCYTQSLALQGWSV